MPRSKGLLQIVAGANPAPKELISTVEYVGDGQSFKLVPTGLNPTDLVITKTTNNVGSPLWTDVNRGSSNYLNSDSTAIEATAAFNSGVTIVTDQPWFTLGNNVNFNSLYNYVAWCFAAGSTPVSNSEGNVTASVSANVAAGFSIVTYTNVNTSTTVGHGLDQAPELVIQKNRDTTTANWIAWTTAIDGSFDSAILNTGQAFTDASSFTSPTDTLLTSNYSNAHSLVAYCFHSVPGTSKIGSYAGTAADVTVTTGFTPAFLMVKRTLSGDWYILDATRSTSNPRQDVLSISTGAAESNNSAFAVDFNASGFTVKSTATSINASGSTYFYMAIASAI